MKGIISVLFLLIFFSCQKNNENLIVSASKLPTKETPIKKNFCYIALVVVHPTIAVGEDNSRYFDWDVKVYISHIQEIPNLTEEIEYKYIDEYSDNIRKTSIALSDNSFLAGVKVYGIDSPEKESKILFRNFYRYDTYKEASITSNEIQVNPDKYAETLINKNQK